MRPQGARDGSAGQAGSRQRDTAAEAPRLGWGCIYEIRFDDLDSRARRRDSSGADLPGTTADGSREAHCRDSPPQANPRSPGSGTPPVAGPRSRA
jgi:hypothetical protein